MINCSELVYKVGNKVDLLPTLYYLCTTMSIDERHSIKQSILDYARNYGRIEVPQLVSGLGIKANTARQYLCTLAKENKIARTGNGEYMLTDKQVFSFAPEREIAIHRFLHLRWQHLHHTTTSRLCEPCYLCRDQPGCCRFCFFSVEGFRHARL